MIINTKTPCCTRPVRLMATEGIPVECYDRTCQGCHTKWQARRELVLDHPTGLRVDVVEWSVRPENRYTG